MNTPTLTPKARRKPLAKAAAAALVSTLCGAAAVHAQAPSGVTLYGVLDVGVEHVSNVGAAGGGLSRMPSNTASTPSRWGLRGSEDLGGGLRAIFTLEAGLGLDSGLLGQGGRAWGRQAFVGLAGPWGSVTFGRQYTMLFWSMLDADVLGPNAHGSAALDAYIPNARADNAIAWRGSFDGLTLGAHYSLGRDAVNAGPSPVGTNCAGEVAGDSKTCRGWSLLAKFDRPGWGVAAVVDRQHGGPGAFGGLASGALRDTRSMLNGYVKLGGTKLGAGWLRRDNEGSPLPKSDLWFAGVSHPVTPTIVLDAELLRLAVKSSPNRATLAALRGTYLLSRRSAAYVSLGHIANDGSSAVSVSAGQPGSNPAPGGSQTGLLIGLRHAF